MIKVKTKVGDVGLVEVPTKDIFTPEIPLNKVQYRTFSKKFINFYTSWGETQDLGIRHIYNVEIPSEFVLFGKLSELNKELEEFVEKRKEEGFYINYIARKCGVNYWEPSLKKSFISLIKSQHPDFQEDKDYLLIKLLWKYQIGS